MLRVWNAFLKSLSHSIIIKQVPIYLPRIGIFKEKEGFYGSSGQLGIKFNFVPRDEIATTLGCLLPDQWNDYEANLAAKVTWKSLASEAGVESGEVAETIVYQVFQ